MPILGCLPSSLLEAPFYLPLQNIPLTRIGIIDPLVWLWLDLHEWMCFYYHSAIYEQSRIGPNVTVVCSTNHQLILWQINSGNPFPASQYESTIGNRTSSLTLTLEGTTVIRCFGKTASFGAQEANITLEPEGNKLLCCRKCQRSSREPLLRTMQDRGHAWLLVLLW